jgi:hypothetical protein
MGYRIVKQPDGKLAVFSSYCDQWAACDASAADVRDWFAASAVESSNISCDRITEAVLDDRPEDVYYRDVSTIEELDARSLRHGGKTLADLIATAPLIEPKTHEPDWRALLTAVIETGCYSAMPHSGDCQYCDAVERIRPSRISMVYAREPLRHNDGCPWAAAEKALDR